MSGAHSGDWAGPKFEKSSGHEYPCYKILAIQGHNSTVSTSHAEFATAPSFKAIQNLQPASRGSAALQTLQGTTAELVGAVYNFLAPNVPSSKPSFSTESKRGSTCKARSQILMNFVFLGVQVCFD